MRKLHKVQRQPNFPFFHKCGKTDVKIKRQPSFFVSGHGKNFKPLLSASTDGMQALTCTSHPQHYSLDLSFNMALWTVNKRL